MELSFHDAICYLPQVLAPLQNPGVCGWEGRLRKPVAFDSFMLAFMAFFTVLFSAIPKLNTKCTNWKGPSIACSFSLFNFTVQLKLCLCTCHRLRQLCRFLCYSSPWKYTKKNASSLEIIKPRWQSHITCQFNIPPLCMHLTLSHSLCCYIWVFMLEHPLLLKKHEDNWRPRGCCSQDHSIKPLWRYSLTASLAALPAQLLAC